MALFLVLAGTTRGVTTVRLVVNIYNNALRGRGRGRDAEGVFMPRDEGSIAVVKACLYDGEAVGGRMRITNRGVLFEPHLFNFHWPSLELLYEDISEVREGGGIPGSYKEPPSDTNPSRGRASVRGASEI